MIVVGGQYNGWNFDCVCSAQEVFTEGDCLVVKYCGCHCVIYKLMCGWPAGQQLRTRLPAGMTVHKKGRTLSQPDSDVNRLFQTKPTKVLTIIDLHERNTSRDKRKSLR